MMMHLSISCLVALRVKARKPDFISLNESNKGDCLQNNNYPFWFNEVDNEYILDNIII